MTGKGKIYEFGLKKLPNSRENRLDDLIVFCRKNDITEIFDVRWERSCHYTKWVCNGIIMPEVLKKNLLNYKWYKELGVPKKDRGYNWTLFTDNYFLLLQDMYETKLHNGVFSMILDILRSGRNIVLLCTERHQRCHRFLLKKFLEEKLMRSEEAEP